MPANFKLLKVHKNKQKAAILSHFSRIQDIDILAQKTLSFEPLLDSAPN